MRTISKLGQAALILALATLAFACSQVSTASNGTSAAPNGTTTANATPATAPAQSPEDKMPRTKADEAKRLVEDGKAVVIDVRGTEAYKSAHIKGSLDVPLNKLEAGDFKGLPKDKQLIAYCT